MVAVSSIVAAADRRGRGLLRIVSDFEALIHLGCCGRGQVIIRLLRGCGCFRGGGRFGGGAAPMYS
jgi:hypothetical protein